MSNVKIFALLSISAACAPSADMQPRLGEQVQLCTASEVSRSRELYRLDCRYVTEACVYWLQRGDVPSCLDIQVFDPECPCTGGDL